MAFNNLFIWRKARPLTVNTKAIRTWCHSEFINCGWTYVALLLAASEIKIKYSEISLKDDLDIYWDHLNLSPPDLVQKISHSAEIQMVSSVLTIFKMNTITSVFKTDDSAINQHKYHLALAVPKGGLNFEVLGWTDDFVRHRTTWYIMFILVTITIRLWTQITDLRHKLLVPWPERHCVGK